MKNFFSKKKPNNTCIVCGQDHGNWPAYGFMAPVYYDELTEEEKSDIAKLSSDFCEIHHPDQIDRFIRVVLRQKVIDHTEDLEYGVWVSLSEKSYTDYADNFDSENHETTYFGWLCNTIPDYETMLEIPVNVNTKKGNERPEIFPHQDFEHPFVADYYNGITLEEAQKRIHNMLAKYND